MRERDDAPPIEAQFFYSSLIPIDDPLSTSSVTGGSDTKSGKAPLRPFARGDNNTLEKAWLGLRSDGDRSDHDNARKCRKQTASEAKATAEKRALLVQTLARKHSERHRAAFEPQDLSIPAELDSGGLTDRVCCPGLIIDITEELEKTFCALARQVDSSLQPDRILQDVIGAIDRWRQPDTQPSQEPRASQLEEPSATVVQDIPDVPFPFSSPQKPKPKPEVRSDTIYHKYPIGSLRERDGRPRSTSQATNHSSRAQTPVGSPAPARSYGVDDGICGKPFVRVGTNGEQSPQLSASIPRYDSPVPAEGLRDEESDHLEVLEPPGIGPMNKGKALESRKYGKQSVEVAVGVSRLHMVSLPTLQMKPIYWSPVNDMAVVMRATWFYRLVDLLYLG